MMKFEVQTNDSKEEITYPCLLKSKKSPLVIFAPIKEEGAIIMVEHAENGWIESRKQGEYYGDFNEDDFELFQGSITLSN